MPKNGKSSKKRLRNSKYPLRYTAPPPVRRVELKTYDTETTTTDLLAGSMYTRNIAAVAIGDTGKTRDGKDIFVTSLMARVHVSFNDSGVILKDSSKVRILLVQDRQTSNRSATPGYGDIMDTATTFRNDMLAFRNLSNADRFRILDDKLLVLMDAVNTQEQVVSFYHQFKKPVKCSFTNTLGTPTITEMAGNTFYLFALSDASTATKYPSFSAMTRIRFTD